VRRLQELGFANAYVLKGGLKAWWEYLEKRRETGSL
jgi:rhodanese-related sulfurtransferase